MLQTHVWLCLCRNTRTTCTEVHGTVVKRTIGTSHMRRHSAREHYGPTSPSNTSPDIDAPFCASATLTPAAIPMLMRKNIVNHSCPHVLSRSRLHGNSASDISSRIVHQVLMRPAVGSVACTRMYTAPSCKPFWPEACVRSVPGSCTRCFLVRLLSGGVTSSLC